MRLSISKIRLFKACRRAYQLKHLEGLVPVETAEPLQTGLGYHSRIESLYKGHGVDITDFSKEAAMAVAYMKYIYPEFRMHTTEEWLTYQIGEHVLVGRADGIAEDGNLVEHKTTSMEITEEYEYDLQWDEQILAYMLITGARDIYYTVCRKPTIRKKKNETDEEFFNRMVEWYDEDTESKIRLMLIHRTDEEVNQFKEELENMAVEMDKTSNFYRNTAYCRKWNRRCEYSSICLHYDREQEYIEFTKEKPQ